MTYDSHDMVKIMIVYYYYSNEKKLQKWLGRMEFFLAQLLGFTIASSL
jgi:hypothetical protein